MTAADEGPLDPVLVAALFAEHADELRRFLTGVLRDGHLANDVLQTAFSRLLEQGHTTQEGSRKAWLFRVAYNEALAIRRRQAVGERVTRKVSWTTATSQANEDQLVRQESVAAVRQALQTLPPEQQRIVRMRIFEEKTFAVIAAELNIPLGTALARMHSALAKLREKLKDK